MGEFWDKDKMKEHKDAVRYCFDENQKYHNRVRCYAEAFASLNTDIYTLAEDCLNKDKLASYIKRLTKKLIPKAMPDGTGKIEFKQLSAFTTENYMTHPISGEYSKYFIKDDLFAGGDYFLKSIAEIFINNGYDVTVSECTMLHNSTFEHLIVEQLGLVFITGNFFNGLVPENENIINFSRFYDKEMYSNKKQRINFDKKASLELAKEASVCLKTALDIHDELEKFYINAIDFESLNHFTAEFIESLKK